MEQADVQLILLSILTSIITGGFILVFVEIGNRQNRENDRFDHIMMPFMHKLSSYFKFLSWCSSRIKYPKRMSENEIEFKRLVKEIGGYGGRAIVSGGDYGVDYFSAQELYDICSKINDIWYYHDKMTPCCLTWNDIGFDDQFIFKELKEIFPNYLSRTIDVNLVSDVSGDFYSDIYQPIENETYKHEAYVEHFKRQFIFVAYAVGFVLLVLTSMLFVQLSVLIMQATGLVVVILLLLCLLLLSVETNIQIKYYNRFFRNMKEMRKNDICKKSVNFLLNSMTSVGLLLAAWAILCIELGVLPTIPVSWDESVVLGINRLFLNLSYSYITAIVVYWFAFKFPSLRKM